MKIAVFSDIHGDVPKLKEVVASDKELSKCDAVICNGDFTDMFKIKRQLQIANVRDVVSVLAGLGKPLLCVPGNHDPPGSLAVFDGAGANIHGKRRSIGGFDFAGFGGAITPFGTNFEPPGEEEYKTLDSLAGAARNPLVLVVHNPPKGHLDRTGHGTHVGSEMYRNLLVHYKPLLSLSAHIHEAAGVVEWGPTTLFYPGPLFEGKYGMVSLGSGRPVCSIKEI